MQKGKITVLGHRIECRAENLKEVKIEMLLLTNDIRAGKKSGVLYGKVETPADGTAIDIPQIGTWKIINPEAEKLQKICEDLKAAMLWGDRAYKELKWKDDSIDNLEYTIVENPWKEIAHLMYEDLKYGVTREELQNTLSAYEKLKEKYGNQ